MKVIDLATDIYNGEGITVIGLVPVDLYDAVQYTYEVEKKNHIPNNLDPTDVCMACDSVDGSPTGGCRWQAALECAEKILASAKKGTP